MFTEYVYLIIVLQSLATPEAFNALGAIAIVLFILKEVFSFIKSVIPQFKNGETNGNRQHRDELHKITDNNVSHIRSDVQWLREVHDKSDEDGKYLWYFPKSMERAIIENTAAMKTMTAKLNNLKLK